MEITERHIDGYKTIEYNEKHIFIVENIFDNEFCDEITKLIETIPLTKRHYDNGQNVLCHLITQQEIMKLSENLYYPISTDEKEYLNILETINSTRSIYTNSLNGETFVHLNDIFNRIDKKLKIIKNIFNELNPRLNFNNNSGFILRKIYGKTRNHIDGPISGMTRKTLLKYINERNTDHLNVQYIRSSSCIFCLNEDYENGEFYFPYQNVKLRLTKGSLICFPPYWTHPHEVSEPTNNTYRYTLSTWFCEKHIPV